MVLRQTWAFKPINLITLSTTPAKGRWLEGSKIPIAIGA
jgi:hypothetical protein